MLHLKAEITLIKIERMRTEKTIRAWSVDVENNIGNTGEHKYRGTGKEEEYYESCISTIDQVIYLRQYDSQKCRNGNDESHIPFIKILNILKEKITYLISIIPVQRTPTPITMGAFSVNKNRDNKTLNDKNGDWSKPSSTDNTDNNEEKEI